MNPKKPEVQTIIAIIISLAWFANAETDDFIPAWNSEALNKSREKEQRIRSFDQDFTAADYVPEAPGKISKYTAWDINKHATLALEDLDKVPDGKKGKGLPDHALLKQMALDLQTVAVSMKRNELIQLIPRLLALDSMDKEYDEVLWSSKQWIDGNATNGVIGDIAAEEIEEKQGTVDASVVEKLALTYCNVRFHPGEELVFQFPETIDASAIFILDPVKVTAILKTRNLRDVTYFLPAIDFENYFKNFEVGGGGLELLKVKFAAKKDVIRQKFDEATAYRKQLEAQNPD